jgi:hypothetical protein
MGKLATMIAADNVRAKKALPASSERAPLKNMVWIPGEYLPDGAPDCA